jgi:hypothetical protein
MKMAKNSNAEMPKAKKPKLTGRTGMVQNFAALIGVPHCDDIFI